jgi:hypothetical protein
MSDDLRRLIARALSEHQQPGGLDRDRYPVEEWLCCADAVMAVLDERQRAYEDLLGDISLYVDWRYLTTKMTDAQKTLWADSHDAWAARIAVGDPAYGEPSKAERWWIDG